MKGNWIKTNDYYNREVVTKDVWSCKTKLHRITVYVIDKPNFMFTVSAGANSDLSYTGCFFEHPEIKTVQDAIEAIEKKHKSYF